VYEALRKRHAAVAATSGLQLVDEVVDVIDVAERTADGRLRRIMMFHGPLPVGE
jgi:hypothetical protein